LYLELLAAAISLAFAPLFYWRFLTSDPQAVATLPTGDFTELHYPFQRWVAEQVARGVVPWWNGFILGGHSASGDIQFFTQYPPSLILARLLDGGFPLRGLEIGIIAHVALGSFFTYLLVRRLTASRVGGLVAAVVFGFGGYLATFPIQQINILEASVWLPLILLLVDIGAAYRLTTAFVLAAGGMALAALAGHPQTLLYVATAASLYALFKLWNGGRLRPFVLIGLPTMLVGGVALAADALVPAFQHLSLTDRPDATYAFSSGGYALRELIGLIFPGEFGGTSLYVGVFSLLLAAVGLGTRRCRSNKLFWIGLGTVGLLFSFGGNTFLQGMLYLALGSIKFHDHERMTFFVAIAVAVLAGYGAAEVTRSGRFRPEWLGRGLRWPTAAAVALGVLVLVGYATAPNESRGNVGPLVDRVAFTAIVLVLGAAILAGRRREIIGPALAGLLALLLVGFDLFSTNWQNNVRPGEPTELLQTSPIVDYLQSYTTGLNRVSSEGLLPGDGNAGALFRLEDIVGNSPLETSDYAEFDRSVPELARWQILNVRYIVTQRKFDDTRFRILRQDGPKTLYELASRVRLPRAYVVQSMIPVPSHRQALDLLKDVDLRRQAVVEMSTSVAEPFATLIDPEVILPSAASNATSGLSGSSVRVASDGENEVVLYVALASPGLVVLSDVYYPGWQVTIDGRVAEIIRTNGIVRSVLVPVGSHEIHYWFEPPGLALGMSVREQAILLLADLVVADIVLWALWYGGRYLYLIGTRARLFWLARG